MIVGSSPTVGPKPKRAGERLPPLAYAVELLTEVNSLIGVNMVVDLDTVRTRIAARDAYWRAVAALETMDVKAFFEAICDAHVALYGVSYVLNGCASWHFNPHEVPSILERFDLEVGDFKLLCACPYGSCLSLDASFEYRGYPVYVSAFFAYRH